MSLKSSIVIVNKYSIKNPVTGKGSRGSSPGNYVERYMSRSNATELVAPIRYHNVDDFLTRYMVRSAAVEELSAGPRPPGRSQRRPAGTTLSQRRAERSMNRQQIRQERLQRRLQDEQGQEQLSPPAALSATPSPVAHPTVDALKERFARARGSAGVAFGNGRVSLSHEDLKVAGQQTQELFDKGHTVLFTVISFTDDYLRSHGLIPEDMGKVRAGDYRGQLDQMKLRMAIMRGMERMASTGYSDLRYVGALHVDTKQVHCHLTIVDAGRGLVTEDGTQRGKIPARAKSMFRRGVDSWLDQQKTMVHLSSAVGYERRNIVSYVKRWAHQTMATEATGQFLLACLPENKNLWRASSHAESMTKPNRIVRELVEQRLAQPDSPMPQAMREVTDYARSRAQREDLSRAEQQQLIDSGRERIVEAAVNGVYTTLAAIPEEQRTVVTGALATMSQDYQSLLESTAQTLLERGRSGGVSGEGRSDGEEQVGVTGQETSFEEFSLRLRSYSSRLEHHRRMREKYHLKARAWEQANQAGRTTSASALIYDFYRSERGYHARAQSKYQHFLDFNPGSAQWREEWSTVDDYGRRLTGLRALRTDRSLARMADPQAAETLGRELYGQSGGGLLAATGAQGRSGRAQIDGRIQRMTQRYRQMIDDLKQAWAQLAARLDVDRVEPEAGARDGLGGPTDTAGDTESAAQAGTRWAGRPSRVALVPGQTPVPADDRDTDIYTPGAPVVVRLEPEFEFNEVKGIDLHDMHYDWLEDQAVPASVGRRFHDLAATRREHLEMARAYLEATGQGGEVVSELGEAEADVFRMEATAAQVQSSGTLRSELLDKARQRIREQTRAREQAQELSRQQDGDSSTGVTQPQVLTEATPTASAAESGRAWRTPSPTYPLSRRVDRSLVEAMDQAVSRSREAEIGSEGWVD